MRTTVTVVAWSLCVCVCLLVTIASCTKTAETTDMPCGLWTPGDPSNRVLDDCPDSPTVGHFSKTGHKQACPDLPAVDILNRIR